MCSIWHCFLIVDIASIILSQGSAYYPKVFGLSESINVFNLIRMLIQSLRLQWSHSVAPVNA